MSKDDKKIKEEDKIGQKGQPRTVRAGGGKLSNGKTYQELKDAVKPKKEEQINTKDLKVKDLKKLLKDKDDEANVVFLSTSGMEWRINENVLENPKKKKDQVVIYLK